MRVPYISESPTFTDPTDQAIVQRIRERRGSAGLIELDRALLHSPPVADGWNSFLNSIRTRTSLPASLLELSICRVAVLNQAWYEWSQHMPLFLAAPGVAQAHVDAVRACPPHGRVQDVLDETQNAVLAYTDAMTLDVRVSDEVFNEVKKLVGVKGVVELTAAVGAYNCVSRFLVALDVGEMNGQGERT